MSSSTMEIAEELNAESYELAQLTRQMSSVSDVIRENLEMSSADELIAKIDKMILQIDYSGRQIQNISEELMKK